jgi:hypothetical protein
MRTAKLVGTLALCAILEAAAWAHQDDATPPQPAKVTAPAGAAPDDLGQLAPGGSTIGAQAGRLSVEVQWAPSGLRGWTVRFPEFDLGAGVSVSLGELGERINPRLVARAVRVAPFTLRLHEELAVGKARLFVDGEASLSLLQGTHGDGDPFWGAGDTLVACGSQSSIGVAIGAFVGALELSAFATKQADPFHFTDGRGCVGNPGLWLEGQMFGGRAAIEPTRWLTAAVTVRAERDRLSYDFLDHPGGTGAGSYAISTWSAVVSLDVHAPRSARL